MFYRLGNLHIVEVFMTTLSIYSGLNMYTDIILDTSFPKVMSLPLFLNINASETVGEYQIFNPNVLKKRINIGSTKYSLLF